MNPSIQAVTFDVGGTLMEPFPSVGQLYAEVAEGFGIRDVAPVDLDRQFAAAWAARGRFDYSRRAWRNLVTRTFAAVTPVAPGEACFAAIYRRFACASAWRVFDDALPALAQLKEQGCKLGIISNWDERLRPLLQELGLAKWFDAVAISHEVGHGKPSHQIFHHAAGLLLLPPGSILHVGDSEREDAAGARAAGFQAIVVERRSTSARAISSLGALLQAQTAPSPGRRRD